MIVVMKPNATEEMVQAMVRRVEEMGLKAHVIIGEERTVIAAAGIKRDGHQEVLESCAEVEKVVPSSSPLIRSPAKKPSQNQRSSLHTTLKLVVRMSA